MVVEAIDWTINSPPPWLLHGTARASAAMRHNERYRTPLSFGASETIVSEQVERAATQARVSGVSICSKLVAEVKTAETVVQSFVAHLATHLWASYPESDYRDKKELDESETIRLGGTPLVMSTQPTGS